MTRLERPRAGRLPRPDRAVRRGAHGGRGPQMAGYAGGFAGPM